MSGETAYPATDCDVLVVGSGIAGCAAALSAAREGADVLVATKASEPADAATDWAQGGIAVTQSDPESFAADIRAAGDGECDPAAVDALVADARTAVEDVLVDTLGVPFDEPTEARPDATFESAAADRAFDLHREAAHAERRILHVDAETGRHVLRPFLRRLRDRPEVRFREDTAAYDLVVDEGRVTGALVEPSTDADAPAALAGADVRDAHYVQFHPTALDTAAPAVDDDADGLLVSEAVRGAGAQLVNADGRRFMPDVHEDAELAPRDVVARAVADERERTGAVRLDVSSLDFAGSFPALSAGCRARGLDPAEGVPVRPAQHFLCGGVDVDRRGRASLDRLYAAGECARTGVHGANRLASTSLLEGLVWGLRAGADAAERAPLNGSGVAPTLRDGDPALPERFADDKLRRLRTTMADAFGLERDPGSMARATAGLRRLKGEVDAYTRTRTSRELYELRNAVVTALLIARAAADAPSAGCHYVAEPEEPGGAPGGATAPRSGGDGRAD